MLSFWIVLLLGVDEGFDSSLELLGSPTAEEVDSSHSEGFGKLDKGFGFHKLGTKSKWVIGPLHCTYWF